MEQDRQPRSGDGKEQLAPLSVYADLFVQRWDTYARQKEGSRSYYRVLGPHRRPLPLTPEILAKHLRGELTIGLYSVDQQGLTTWSVLDSDRGLAPVVRVRDELAGVGIPSLLEASRMGGHLWIFYDQPVHPAAAKNLLRPYAQELELFPAGDVPDDDGLGLLIRAPLGVHRFSGQRYPFLGDDLTPVSAGVARGQLEWLAQHVQRVRLPPQPEALRTTPGLTPSAVVFTLAEQQPIAQFLAEHGIREVVGSYVRLNRSGIGRCPWPENHKHGDRHPSFAVFDRTHKWWCFTERVGGTAFDFLCRYHTLTPGEMLSRLRG